MTGKREYYVPAMKRILLLLGLAVAGCASSTPAPAVVAPAPARLAAAPDRFFTTDGVRLRYREVGRGEPIVLLHGYTARLEYLGDLADSLAGDNRVIVLDQRGFGESSKLSDPARFGRRMGDDVVALLDELNIRRAHLVGHSMGALIAANVAARFPDRAAGVGLIAGPFYPDSAAFAGLSAGWVTALERGEGFKGFLMWILPGMPDSAALAMNAQMLAANDMGSLLAAMRAMGGLVVGRDFAGRIRAPAVIAVGTGDPLYPQSQALAAWWPSARLVLLPEVNHLAIVVRPEVIGALREMVRR
jgi:pimeloyl-ACP methyl ester carboxylesterase